ncbi:MAG: dihydrodipicolinate synthase family protein [Candidatus Caldatribacteriaceae bacterium]
MKGVIVPLITPLTKERKTDLVLLKEYLIWILKSGVNGVLLGGSMGEYPTLDEKERREILELGCKVAEERVTLIANISDVSEEKVFQNMKAIEALPIHAYIVTPPYYFLYTQSELKGFFSRIADKAKKPILLYNIPEFVGNILSPELILSLTLHPNIRGLKDSSGNFAHFITVLLEKPDSFSLLQGYTEMSVASLLLGCEGIVSGLSNLLPNLFVQLFSLAKRGKVEEAKKSKK